MDLVAEMFTQNVGNDHCDTFFVFRMNSLHLRPHEVDACMVNLLI